MNTSRAPRSPARNAAQPNPGPAGRPAALALGGVETDRDDQVGGEAQQHPTPPYTAAEVSELVISGRVERGDGPLTASSEAPTGTPGS